MLRCVADRLGEAIFVMRETDRLIEDRMEWEML